MNTCSPPRLLCFPAEVEVSNRIVRRLGPAAAECLLRMSFCDEGLKPHFSCEGPDDLGDIYAHILKARTPVGPSPVAEAPRSQPATRPRGVSR